MAASRRHDQGSSRRKNGGLQRLHPAALSCSTAVATISASPGVVGSDATSAGSTQRHSLEFLVELRLARDPARGERQDHEMPLDLVLGVARHHLAVAGERDRLDGERRSPRRPRA